MSLLRVVTHCCVPGKNIKPNATTPLFLSKRQRIRPLYASGFPQQRGLESLRHRAKSYSEERPLGKSSARSTAAVYVLRAKDASLSGAHIPGCEGFTSY